MNDDPAGHSVCSAIQDLLGVIEEHGLRSPILVGRSWGGFLSLKFLEKHPKVVKGVVIVCSPIDYPEAFYNILAQVHRIYDGMRFFVTNEGLSQDAEIEKLKNKMFPVQNARRCDDAKTSSR